MTAPVRVTLSPELSDAVRYLAEHLEPAPSLTGLVRHAVREFIEKRANESVFRDLRKPRAMEIVP